MPNIQAYREEVMNILLEEKPWLSAVDLAIAVKNFENFLIRRKKEQLDAQQMNAKALQAALETSFRELHNPPKKPRRKPHVGER